MLFFGRRKTKMVVPQPPLEPPQTAQVKKGMCGIEGGGDLPVRLVNGVAVLQSKVIEFLERGQLSGKRSKKGVRRSSQVKFSLFSAYGWPGNLRRSVPRATLRAGTGTAALGREDIPFVSWAKNPRCGLPQEGVEGRVLGMTSSKHVFYCYYEGEGLIFWKGWRPSSAELQK